MTKDKQFQIRITEKMYQDLKAIAERLGGGLTVSNIVRMALERYLKERE